MPEPLLTILKFYLLAIVYLFFVRVLRAVWAEMRGPAAVAAPAPPVRPARAAFGGNRPPGRLKVVEPAERRGRTYELGDELTVGRGGGGPGGLGDDKYLSQTPARG